MVVAPVTTIDLSLSTGKEYAAIQSALPEVIRADTRQDPHRAAPAN
jgi:hypothetical protein